MDGEIIPDYVSEKDLRDEVNRRTARAGYTTRAGECPYRTKIMAQPPNEQYRKNYDKIDWSRKD
jgi:hypothetical protein